MKLKLNKDILLSKFLIPISRVGEKCVISIYPDHIQSCLTTNDSNPILYANITTTSDLGGEKEVNLNIPNVNKLINIFNCIPSEEVELEVNSNNIEYKSLNMSFKYHLLEDGVIDKIPVSQEKLKKLAFNTDFVIDREKVADIMKGSRFAVDSDKLYFYIKDDKVFAELTDKQIANTDSVSYFITDEYSGEDIKKPILIDLEIFRMISGVKERLITKINSKIGTVLFKLEDDDYTLQYIVSSNVK